MKNFEMKVVRFSNSDVISTSGDDIFITLKQFNNSLAGDGQIFCGDELIYTNSTVNSTTAIGNIRTATGLSSTDFKASTDFFYATASSFKLGAQLNSENSSGSDNADPINGVYKWSYNEDYGFHFQWVSAVS